MFFLLVPFLIPALTEYTRLIRSGVSKMVKVLVAFVWVRANVMLLVISTAYDGLEQ